MRSKLAALLALCAVVPAPALAQQTPETEEEPVEEAAAEDLPT
jgi:hypothetical protein